MTPLDTLHNLIPMNLASLSFVYVLLPVCLLVYYLAPKRFRPAVLLAASIGFYMLAEPENIILCVVVAAVGYAFICAVVMLRGHFLHKTVMWLCVVFNLGLAGYFSLLSGTVAGPPPLGLLVICLSIIDAVLEAYREEEPQQRNIIRYAVFVMFFPRLYVGPLVNPDELYKSCGNAQTDPATVLAGFGRFAEGLLKYAAIGRSLFLLYEAIRAIPEVEITILSAWTLILSFALALYYTLSGLADIARGIAGMFGIILPQNFYYPYQSRSVSDFFERFNMTGVVFLRRVGLVPISLSQEPEKPAVYSARLMLAGILWGSWFGIRANYLAWGAFIAVFMILEKYLYPRAINAAPTLFCRCYAFFAVLISFTFFAGDGAAQSLGYLSSMFGLGGIDILNRRILYILSMNWVLLVLSAILATNIINLIVSALRKVLPKASIAVLAAIDVCALILFTSLTLGGGVL